MIGRLKNKFSLYFNPPKKGDVFFADVFDFLCESNSERIFFEMTDRHGHSLWHFVTGTSTYRFTIENAAVPYYVCKVEILVCGRDNPHKKSWLKRSRPRRIWKKDFHRLILEERMVKTESRSLFG
jgi:hypothetical protein